MKDVSSQKKLLLLKPLFALAIDRASYRFESENDGMVRVVSGFRTDKEQQAMVRRGASRTNESLHETGEAADLVVIRNGMARYDQIGLFRLLNLYLTDAAKESGFRLLWGGTWPTLRDFSHWQVAEVSRSYVAGVEGTPDP